MARLLAVLAVLVALVQPVAALAQTTPAPETPPATTPGAAPATPGQPPAEGGAAAAPVPPVEPKPAYEDDLLRLSEILGSLHYLRTLCRAGEGATWRERMNALVETEQPSPERRARLIARFNRGFRAFGASYRQCTPAAAEAANRYLREGARLAGSIPTRYGN